MVRVGVLAPPARNASTNRFAVSLFLREPVFGGEPARDHEALRDRAERAAHQLRLARLERFGERRA